MESVSRTIYAGHLLTTKMLNRPFTILPNSTLNQKFALFENEVPNLNEYPTLKYIAIGNKGASYDITTSGFILTTPTPHLPRHASLYNFIPFIVRPIDDDIAAGLRANYRLRVPLTIGGVQHVAYYLKVLDTSALIPTVELRNVNEGVITSASFEPTISDLSPVPPVINNTNLNTPNGDYLVSTAKITFSLDALEIQEILDAANLIYGDPRYAVINEIALITGVDKVLTGTFGATTSSYTEVITTQVAAFISQYHALTSNTTGVDILLDIGNVDSLLV